MGFIFLGGEGGVFEMQSETTQPDCYVEDFRGRGKGTVKRHPAELGYKLRLVFNREGPRYPEHGPKPTPV